MGVGAIMGGVREVTGENDWKVRCYWAGPWSWMERWREWLSVRCLLDTCQSSARSCGRY